MNPHKHNYFLQQVKADFVPVEYGQSSEDTLYKRVEYAILSCGCGEAVKKVIVKNGENQA